MNDEPLPWRAGLTVADVLREREFVFPLLVVSIDGVHVPRDAFAATAVPDGAVVVVMHLMSGG
ncbi:MAG: sulfur carrier protein ThiS [Deltaproteobacteria bacterium]|nr:sulfur carrier protein ThiS [Deltaproteobacteria bacterium]